MFFCEVDSTRLYRNRIVDSNETNCPDPLIKKMIFIFNMKRQINLIHCLFDQKKPERRSSGF